MISERDLYSSIRTIYSPGYVIGEFWAEHIYSGLLDTEAGDGTCKPTAIPIVTDNEDLRQVIAELFRVSNLQVQMGIYARFGAVCGDVLLTAQDDPERQQVYIKPIHARVVRDIVRDPMGNVKGYTYLEPRDDPRVSVISTADQPQVMYGETCTRHGDSVVYETFLDGQPYDWRDYNEGVTPVGSTWTEQYGFVPVVFVQHRDKGLNFGWSELHPTLGKLMELDEVASKVNDQIRKLVECPWLFIGMNGEEDMRVSFPTEEAADEKNPERNRIPAIYASDPQAKAQALVANLDIPACLQNRKEILEGIERDHPELQADMANSSGDASGRALRVAREKVEARVVAVRNNYDSALKRVIQMAISIGAQKQYPGYEKFTEASFLNGELEFSIGGRSVFSVDTLATIEEEQARATVLKTYLDAGMPMDAAMEFAGYSEAQIEKAMTSKAKESEARAAAVVAKMAARFPEMPVTAAG
jgi:hypothetical protein